MPSHSLSSVFFFLFIYFFNDISLDCVVLLENTNDFFFVFDVVVFSILFCYVTTFFSSWALNARENRAFFSSVRCCKIEREKTAHRQIITSNNGLLFLSCELAFFYFCSASLVRCSSFHLVLFSRCFLFHSSKFHHSSIGIFAMMVQFCFSVVVAVFCPLKQVKMCVVGVISLCAQKTI